MNIASTRPSPTSRPSAARSRRAPTSSPPPCRRGVPTSPTRSTWSRRSRASSATRTCRACCRTAPSGRGLTPAQSMRRRVGRTLAGEGYVEVLNFPFVGEADLDRLGLDAADSRRTTLRLANPLSSEEPLMTTTLLPGLLRTVARNVSRGTSDLALFETAPVTLPHSGVGAPILPVDRRPDRGGVGRPQQGAARPAAAPRLRRRAATATAPAGGARAARRAGATSSRPRASSPAPSASS